MRLPQIPAPWMAVYIAAVAAAGIDNSQVFNIGDDTTSTSDGTNLFMPTRTILLTANSLGNFDRMTTASPGSIIVSQGDQHIE